MSKADIISELNTYGWTKDGMKENPDIPEEDVFVLRKDVEGLQNKVSDVSVEDVIKRNIPNGIINIKADHAGNGKPQYKAEIDAIKKCMVEYASIVNERKNNVGVNDAIEFADWIDKNNWKRFHPANNDIPTWHLTGYNEKISSKTPFTTEALYKIFQESQKKFNHS